MPNWCENEVTVTATDRGKAEAFVGFVRDGDNYFSFDKIIPMPDELRGTNSPATIMAEEEIARHEEDVEANPDKYPFRFRPLTQEMSDGYKNQYGTDNWYDWAVKNWGTKSDTNCEEVHIGDFGEVRYSFDTAWCPPTPIYQHLTELFPKLNISWVYREEDNQVSGWLR